MMNGGRLNLTCFQWSRRGRLSDAMARYFGEGRDVFIFHLCYIQSIAYLLLWFINKYTTHDMLCVYAVNDEVIMRMQLH